MSDGELKKKTLAIVESYVFDQSYGNQKYILGICKYLDPKRYSVVLVMPNECAFTKILRAGGWNVEVVVPPSRLRRFGGSLLSQNPLNIFATICALLLHNFYVALTLYRRDVSVVQVNNLRSFLSVALAAKMLRKPLIWYVKGHLDNPFLDTLAFHFADFILFQSEVNMRRRYPKIIARYAAKIRIVPNGLDMAEIDNINMLDMGLYGRFRIGYLGQISPLKGIHVLIEAIEEVVRRIPSSRLYLVGDTCSVEFEQYVQKIQQTILDRGLDCVEWCGYRPDALNILAGMDAYVLPSFSEGTPRSIMEAMALEKPVVATAVGGIPELVIDGITGYLVPPNDANALAEALCMLGVDVSRREIFGRRGRERILSSFTIADNVEALMEVFDAAIQARHQT